MYPSRAKGRSQQPATVCHIDPVTFRAQKKNSTTKTMQPQKKKGVSHLGAAPILLRTGALGTQARTKLRQSIGKSPAKGRSVASLLSAAPPPSPCGLGESAPAHSLDKHPSIASPPPPPLPPRTEESKHNDEPALLLGSWRAWESQGAGIKRGGNGMMMVAVVVVMGGSRSRFALAKSTDLA